MRRLAIVALLAGCTSTPMTVDSGAPDSGNPNDGGTPIDGGTTIDSGTPTDGGWRDLFNGSDLTGWDKFLGHPFDGGAKLGLNNDPTGVFTVVMEDGEPAIHVSGETWGSLISQEDFADFELEAEFKWGTHTYPPLSFLDSGLMYLTHGAPGSVNAGGMPLDPEGAFTVSMEYQIAGGDIGGIYDLGPIAYSTGARTHAPEPAGWNRAGIVFQNGTATHFLNDAGVASGSGFTNTWPGQPMDAITHGKLQLQCEGAEIYFRHVRIRTP